MTKIGIQRFYRHFVRKGRTAWLQLVFHYFQEIAMPNKEIYQWKKIQRSDDYNIVQKILPECKTAHVLRKVAQKMPCPALKEVLMCHVVTDCEKVK